MSASPLAMLVLGASGLNLLALLGIVWKGGLLVGQFNSGLSALGDAIIKWREEVREELAIARQERGEHARLIAQITGHLDSLTGRLERLERRDDAR